MSITLTFQIPPFSINKANYRNGNRTQDYRKWCKALHTELLKPENQTKLRKLENEFDKHKHCLHYNIIHYIPSSIYYTKQGYKSRKAKDISNIEKPLIDAISSSKYIKKHNIPILDIDDQFISSMSSKMIAHDLDFRIVVEISIISN